MAITELLNNKLFLQYLSGAGQDLASGHAIGSNVNAVTANYIAGEKAKKLAADKSKETINLFKSLLTPGGKLTMEDKGYTMFLPHLETPSSFDTGGLTKGSPPPSPNTAGKPNPTPAPAGQQTTLNNIGGPKPNPFSGGQLNLDSSAYADLSPVELNNLLSTTLRYKINSAKLPGDIAYKEALRQQAIGQFNKSNQPDPLQAPGPVQIPGEPVINTGDWRSLPNDEKLYRIYVSAAKNIGESDIKTREEYALMQPTEKIKTLTELSNNPELLKLAEGLAKAGGIHLSIGEKVNQANLLGEAANTRKTISYFSGKDISKDVEKTLTSDRYQLPYISTPLKDRPRLRGSQILDIFNNMFASRNIQVVSTDADEKTGVVTWNVIWPNGKEGKVSYALR